MQEHNELFTLYNNTKSSLSKIKTQKSCFWKMSFPWLSANITVLSFSNCFLHNIDQAHNFKEICYTIAGSGCIRIHGKDVFTLKKGDLFYVDAGVPHSLSSDPDDPMEAYVIFFTVSPFTSSDKVPAQCVEDECMLLQQLENHKYIIAADNFGCGKETQEAIASMETASRGEFVKIKNHISSFLMSAVQTFAAIPKRPDLQEIVDKAPSFNAAKIYTFLERHHTEKLTLPIVAKSLHYSPRQFQRILQESMGVSFSRLLLDFRLTHAKELLCNTDKTQEVIAEIAGFYSEKSFYRQFKQYVGKTPSQYRKSMQRPPTQEE